MWLVSGAGRTYALDRDGQFGRVDAELSATLAANAVEVVAKSRAGVRAFAARWTRAALPTSSFELLRFTSSDDGLSFDPASESCP